MKISEFFASIGFKVETQGLDRFTSELDKVEKRIRQVRAEAVKLNMTLRKTGQIRKSLGKVTTAQGSKSAAKSVANLNASAETGAAKISHYTARINRLANAMARLANESARVTLPSGRVSLSGEGRRRQGGSGISGAAAAGGAGMSGFGMNAFVRNMLPFAGASLGAAIIRSTIRSGERMLGSKIAIGAVAGTPEAGQQSWQYINNLADRLALPLIESADQYAKLSAAAQGTGLQGAGVQKLFESVAEFGKARMVEPERLNLSIRALGQMINKQQIMAEELKSQFGEHLPGAMQLAAKAYGGTVQELFKAVEAGEVMADDFLPKLAKVMGEAAREGGALEKALQMSSNERRRAFNEIERLSAALFLVVDGPLANFWLQIQRIVKSIDAEKLGNIVKLLFTPLLLVTRLFGHLAEKMQRLHPMANQLLAVAGGLALTFGSLVTILLLVKGAALAASFMMGLLGTAAAIIASPITLIVIGITALAFAIDHLLTMIRRGDIDFKYLGTRIVDGFKGIYNDILLWVDDHTFGMTNLYNKYRAKYSEELSAERANKLSGLGFNHGAVPLMAQGVPANMYNNTSSNSNQNVNINVNNTVQGNADEKTVESMTDMTQAALFNYLSVAKP